MKQNPYILLSPFLPWTENMVYFICSLKIWERCHCFGLVFAKFHVFYYFSCFLFIYLLWKDRDRRTAAFP